MIPRSFTRHRFVSATITVLLLSMATLLGTHAHANVHDFTFQRWEAEYDLQVRDSGRVAMNVTETVVAEFPETDQNKGIVRALPRKFEGAPAAPHNISVTNAEGVDVPFDTETDDNFLYILTGTEEYVHGRQSYVLKYDIDDVIFTPEAQNHDEFYWDLAPVDHLQEIRQFTATITLDAELTEIFTGASSCYIGHPSLFKQCDVHTNGDASFVVGPHSLNAFETVTVALGFETDVVVQPPQRQHTIVFGIVPWVLGLSAILCGLIGVIYIWSRKRSSRNTGKATIARYEVPLDLPPLLAEHLMPASTKAAVAQFLHLAVQGYMRIEEKEVTTRKRTRSRPLFRLLPKHDSSHQRDNLDTATLNVLFDPSTGVQEFTLPKNSSTFSQEVTQLQQMAKRESVARGLVELKYEPLARRVGWVGLFLTVITLLWSAIGLMLGFFPAGPVAGLITGGFAGLLSIISLSKHRFLTPAGAETAQLLEGVRLFIRVAEQERLQVLQSYSGAERRAISGGEIIEVYEKLLPYAVLMNMEKEWSTVLAIHYESAHIDHPHWYPTLSTAHMNGFASQVASLTGTIASAASYSSSSSGGAGGGGFAGGGGGGGGVGGR